MDDRSGCAETREVLPELAAGAATGPGRARALRHLAACVACRRELAALTTVADELLTLAPAVEPPAGFESAVLARLKAAEVTPGRGRRGCGFLSAAAIAIAATIAACAALGATADDHRLAGAYRETLRIANGTVLTARPFTTPDGIRAGRVFVYQGKPSCVFVVVEYDGATGPYDVNLVTRDGKHLRLADVDVVRGEGSGGTAIDMTVDQIAAVRLSSPDRPPLIAVFR
jgi:hypothetical protein